MLNGGIPEQRTVLVIGGPGVGKSTMAMQFLQEGLASDEKCLYISTEQTVSELTTSFAPFDFDLDHPNLTVTSVHASPRPTIEESESGMALQSLEGDQSIDGPYQYPFEGKYIIEFLEEHIPCDRIVLDSASGLAAISDNEDQFRRVILDLIRLFTDRFEATAIMTAEEAATDFLATGSTPIGTSDLLQFTANGVIRLAWEDIRGARRRHLQVLKMRGVDHDTRKFELGFGDAGIYLAPTDRTSGLGIVPEAIIPTGVEGLDELCGGLVRGHSVLLEYDGRALVDHLVANMVSSAFEEDMAVWLFPSPIMGADRLDRLLPIEWDLERLLDTGQLSVLDGFGAWTKFHDHPGVFYAPSGVLGSLFRRSATIKMHMMRKIAQIIDDRRGDRPQIGTVYTEAFLRWLDPSQVKEVYYWAREDLAYEFDTGFFIHNPATMEAELAEFFHSDAVQVFETTMADDGIQHLHLTKSPIGQPGRTGVLDYAEDEVIVRKS